MINYPQTVISQYANSPIFLQILSDLNEDLDPRVDLDDFYNNVWNVLTAQGWGLDVWGTIVGVSRVLRLTGTKKPCFGFAEAHSTRYKPFGWAPMYSPRTNFYALSLDDESFRALIMVKARANISGCSAKDMNVALLQLFGVYGRCYVHEMGTMRMLFTFEFWLSALSRAILTSSNAMPRPSGVQLAVLQIKPLTTFGFAGTGLRPFGFGTFSHGVQYVS